MIRQLVLDRSGPPTGLRHPEKPRGARSDARERLRLSPGGRSSKYAANDPSLKKKPKKNPVSTGRQAAPRRRRRSTRRRLSQFGTLMMNVLCFSHGDAPVGGGVTFSGAYHNCQEEQLPASIVWRRGPPARLPTERSEQRADCLLVHIHFHALNIRFAFCRAEWRNGSVFFFFLLNVLQPCVLFFFFLFLPPPPQKSGGRNVAI